MSFMSFISCGWDPRRGEKPRDVISALPVFFHRHDFFATVGGGGGTAEGQVALRRCSGAAAAATATSSLGKSDECALRFCITDLNGRSSFLEARGR